MSGGIEEVAKSWLSDPPWIKVFKHTVDVIEDYISYILVRIHDLSKHIHVQTLTIL